MARVDDELGELRKRAYGRGADIHLDSQALERLRELEDERSPGPPVEVEESALPPADDPADESTDESTAEPTAAELDEPRPPNEWIRRLSKLRRSTVVIALSVVAFAVVVAVVLTLVQRVQSDPLQVGATQIARLGQDAGYTVPAIFGGPGIGHNQDAEAYDQFHGLRAIVTTTKLSTDSKATSVCLSIFADEDITDLTSTSFSGQFFSGCGAGEFPALAQFDVATPGLPDDLRSAFPAATALQFVYDKADDEVVVFTSK